MILEKMGEINLAKEKRHFFLRYKNNIDWAPIMCQLEPISLTHLYREIDFILNLYIIIPILRKLKIKEMKSLAWGCLARK